MPLKEKTGFPHIFVVDRCPATLLFVTAPLSLRRMENNNKSFKYIGHLVLDFDILLPCHDHNCSVNISGTMEPLYANSRYRTGVVNLFSSSANLY